MPDPCVHTQREHHQRYGREDNDRSSHIRRMVFEDHHLAVNALTPQTSDTLRSCDDHPDHDEQTRVKVEIRGRSAQEVEKQNECV